MNIPELSCLHCNTPLIIPKYLSKIRDNTFILCCEKHLWNYYVGFKNNESSEYFLFKDVNYPISLWAQKEHNFTEIMNVFTNEIIMIIDRFIPINNQNDLENIFPRLIKLIPFS